MNEDLVKKVRAAAGATWWVVIIGFIWLTVAYFVWLGMMHYCTPLVRDMWGGGGLERSQIQTLSLWFFGALKLALFGLLFAAIWLTLFARHLRRPG